MVSTTTDRFGAVAADVADDDMLSGPAWSRHPTDIARFVVSGSALVVFVLLSLRHPSEVRSVSVDVAQLVSQLPSWLRTVLIGLTQLYMVAAAVVLAIVLGQRRRRLFVLGLVAAGVGAGAMAIVQSWLDEAVPNRVVQVTMETSWLVGAAFPSGAFLTGFTAASVVLGPTTSAGWRRVMTATIALAGLLRVVTAVAVPLNLAVTIALGYAVGSAVLAIAGSPRRTVSRRLVLNSLHSLGFGATEIAPVELDARHSRTFLAHDDRGSQSLVKLMGRDERDAYLIQRFIKSLRVKGLEDQRPRWTVADFSRHEGLTAMILRRRGASVSDVVSVGTTDGGDGIVVMDPARGRRLTEVPAEFVTDDLLDAIWGQLRNIRDQGMAHRWLTARNVLVDIPGVIDEFRWEAMRPLGTGTASEQTSPTVTVVDLRWAKHQAEPHQLGADVAMLTASLALIVGTDRAVAAAARAMSKAELAEALPLVQPLALPADLQRALDAYDAKARSETPTASSSTSDEKPEDLIATVRAGIQAAAGDVQYELLDLERLKLRQILAVVGGVLAAYTFLSFASSWSHIRSALADVSPADVPLLVFLALIPYALGAGILRSVVTRPLPFGQVVSLMFGQSFLNRFTPANSGGMALRVRYLQKRGVDLPSAAASIALSSVASGIGQVVVLATFAIWAGSTSDGVEFNLPDANAAAIALVVVLALAGLVWLTPWGRRVVAGKVVTTARQVWITLKSLASEPSRFVNLFALTIIGKFVTILTFTQSARALEITTSFPKLGLIYLTASSVASAAPTPGGVGAVEAALAAALTGVGIPPTEALSAVFLFRLLSYWLPVPIGYIALQRIRKILID